MNAKAETKKTEGAEKVRWWRNRRRWFYGILLAIPLGGSVVWPLWYRANFPMPFADPAHSLGAPVTKKKGVLPLAYLNLVSKYQRKLTEWKIVRETSNLKLEGSAWIEEISGAPIHFGKNGRISWETEQDWDYQPGQRGIDPFVSRDTVLAKLQEVSEILDGAEYHRKRSWGRHAGGWIGTPDYLELPGTSCGVSILFDGRELRLWLTDEASKSGTQTFPFVLILSRNAEEAD